MFAISVRVKPCARAVRLRVALAVDDDPAVFELHLDDVGQDVLRSSPLGPLTDTRVVNVDVDAARNGDRQLTYARHDRTALPNVRQDFAADAVLLGALARHDALAAST